MPLPKKQLPTPLKGKRSEKREEPVKGPRPAKKPRKPLAKISDKRKAESGADRAYRAAVKERDGNTCQLSHFFPGEPCWGDLEVHHTFPVGRYREHRHTVKYGVTSCYFHHQVCTHGRNLVKQVRAWWLEKIGEGES